MKSGKWLVYVSRLALVVILLLGANYLAGLLVDKLDFEIRPNNETLIHRTLMVAAASYTALLAIPFVPASEIGLAMLAMLGPPIAFLVYVCTVTGLCLAYLAGRLIPIAKLIAIARELRWERLVSLLEDIEALDQQSRLELLARLAPAGPASHILRFRYIALGILLNVPGNVVIGGGGGIAMLAGVSRVFSPVSSLITFAIAVSPVPLLVTIFGTDVLGLDGH